MPRPDRQVYLTGGGELFGNLKAGVASANNQRRTIGKVLGAPVPRAMELEDLFTDAVSDRRHEGHLERPGGDHDLIGRIAVAVKLDEVAGLGAPDGADAAAQHHRESEPRRILGEVGDHVVTAGIAVRIAGERRESALARALADGRELAGPLVTELAHDGDEAALEAIELVGTRLGVAIASLVNIFNPQAVVIGGGVIAAGELLLAPARAEMRRRALPPSRDEVRIVAARFGVEAGMIGAAALAFDGLSARAD